MAVLVTGSTGLVGQAVVDDIGSRVYAASRSGAVHENAPGEVTGLQFDLTADDTVRELPWDDIDGVVHLGAYTDSRGSVDDPHTAFVTNAAGTSALLTSAADNDVSVFVFTSSYWVYDSAVTGTLDESTPVSVKTPYGASKAAAELQCDSFRTQTDMAVTTLRPFNVYGPGARSYQVVPEFVQQALEDGRIEPHPGNPVRDFLYVDDLADLLRTCLREEITGVFNAGSGRGTSIRQLATAVASAVETSTGTTVETRFSGDPEPTDRKVASTEKIRSVIDWEPEMPLADGIDRVIEHHLGNNNVDNT